MPVGQVVLLFPDLAEMNLGDFFAFLEDIAGVPKGTLIKTDFGELKVGLMAVNDIKNIPQNLLLPDVLKIIGAEAERTDDFLKKIQEVVKILNVRWKPRVVSTHGKKSTTWGSVKAR
ncbi:MAG: hypothetical protein HYZ69_02810 [Candidatus Colwellbacteria bacterium]|nr:hypothetical protein [Candidatus Colwellbacteria bacterium]